jgi:hypothetical protein
MKKVVKISIVLFFLMRVVSISYIASATFALVSFGFRTKSFELKNGGENFQINIPFFNIGFLVGQNQPSIIWETILGIMMYGVFFWLLGNVFHVFRQPKLFTEKNVRTLTIFYVSNFLIPILMILYIGFYGNYSQSLWIAIFFHFMMGFFVYFMKVIFKQGLHLQKDQDLYI